MQMTKHEHTVAQSYLRRFSEDGTRVFAFDKPTGRVFRSNVRNVAQEAYFYELPAEIMDNIAQVVGVKDQYLEKLLGVADSYAKTQIDEILGEIEHRPITRAHRIALANVIALQFSRTTLNRQLLRECYEKLTQTLTEEMIQLNFPDVAGLCDVRTEFNEDTWVVQQARQMLDENHMAKLAATLNNHIWVFGVNKTIQPFYTSDHPVVKTAHCSSGGIPLTGLRAPGVEIAYPLSSKWLLYMLERSRFRDMEIMDGRAMCLDPHDVEHFNILQVRKSFRQVYCEKDEFDQARGACKRYPECCDPKRSRVQIVNTKNHIATFFLE
jgi:hypothetical protein